MILSLIQKHDKINYLQKLLDSLAVFFHFIWGVDPPQVSKYIKFDQIRRNPEALVEIQEKHWFLDVGEEARLEDTFLEIEKMDNKSRVASID